MLIHHWTSVNPGIFHDFHLSWICAIADGLNSGILSPSHYALIEKTEGDIEQNVPPFLTSESNPDLGHPKPAPNEYGVIVLAEHPPRVQFVACNEAGHYLQKQNRVVIHRAGDDRVVALIEIVSPANKSGNHTFQKFLEKASAALRLGYHLLIIDLFPPTARDPQGIHGAIWSEICDDTYQAPAGKPLTLAAYSAGDTKKAYIEPISAGAILPEMPLFLEPGSYVNVPLDQTYQQAWQSVPLRWRRVLDPNAK